MDRCPSAIIGGDDWKEGVLFAGLNLKNEAAAGADPPTSQSLQWGVEGKPLNSGILRLQVWTLQIVKRRSEEHRELPNRLTWDPARLPFLGLCYAWLCILCRAHAHEHLR